MVVTTIVFAHTTFLWATCCLICFIPIVKPFLTHWSWLRVVPFIERGNRAHGGYDRSTGDVYSSMAPDPTSDIFRGPCTPILWFVFPIILMRLITDRYFCHFIGCLQMWTLYFEWTRKVGITITFIVRSLIQIRHLYFTSNIANIIIHAYIHLRRACIST
jgi:hypothetical protein